ncbi:MAG: heat-inducible transcriptional repressor HrcA [Alphaproteobacteria bacterium]|nr:heat-inducible transcriptional repressor HrcA [Alphaproteobacteria bacterium]
MTERSNLAFVELSERSREIFRCVVDAYVNTGSPVGSAMLARMLSVPLSPATVRNVMSDLETAGLLYSPHTSAGRLPTEAGLRLFVDGILEIGGLSELERKDIERQCKPEGHSMQELLAEASHALSGLSACASLVVAPKTERALKHIEFVQVGPRRALVVIVTEDGIVENRIIELPLGLPSSTLLEATNYLTARLVGRTLQEARTEILAEIHEHRAQLDELASRVVAEGLATWSGGDGAASLIVRGQARLLEDVTAVEEIERIRALFEALERKEMLNRLLSLSEEAQGVQIFIGSENELFGLSGCSMIVSPFRNSRQQIVGAIGVVGPTRINYARIIPMVDYTAQLIGRFIG